MFFIKKKPFACLFLIILHFFLGISAVLGGAALIISPNGQLLNMSLALLENSPFYRYKAKNKPLCLHFNNEGAFFI
ncbi:hypothetical protein [Niallia sp. NCCP-28]|uniref:hypothetical protein n=1 Tax=Niallia sp. NCCP-28 TaxID=2934712 RepID=UPI0020811F9E|nr:hypothetical protein [Niallia sp. NCCP-28]GKU82612.1 hypothetical protein NCCP28_20080 [Niallia sp. NCCP-28]